ncbi:MAG: PAS domain-containing protein, partial [Myxococcota bacterium]
MIDDRSVLADVLDAMPDSLAVYELDGRVVYANPATERTFGRTLAELAGHRLFELFPDAVGNPFHAAFLRVAAGGPEESFDHYYPPFGRWFANRIRRVGDRIHVQARDATEDIRRRRRLEALERVSEVLASADDLEPDVATDAIAAGLAHLLDADCSIALLTDDATALELAATTHRLVRGEEIRWPADDGMPGEALRTHQTVLAEPAALAAMRDRLPPSIRSLVDREPPGSLLVAPLLDAEGPIGVVIATRGIDARPLTAEDRALVGEITGMVGLHLALARRRSEATSLRHRLSALTDSNPALVSFVGVDTRYQYVNATYERWFGLPRQAMIGQTMEALVGPEAWTTIEGHLRQALGGVGARFRAFLTYPSGGRHVDVQYLPVHGADGSVDGVAVLVFDISAEVALAEAERHRRAEERRATQRLESLLAVTGRLAGAADADEIARVVVDEGVDALDATLAGLWLVSSDRTRLELVRERGFAPSDTAAFRSVGLTGVDSPLFDCVSTGRPVWIESRGGYATRYPRLEALHRPDPPTPLAFAVLPLVIEGVSVGCVNFTVHDEQRLTPDERTYLEVLASHAAEAVRRARLYAEVRDASEAREALIGASPAAIVVLDEGGVVRTWNPAAERIFARPAWA